MKRLGLVIALLASQLYAKEVVVHVFPLVVEFKETPQGIEPQWYVLLGKNAEKDVAFTAGVFQEFGGTLQVRSLPIDDKMLWNFAINTYLAAGTNNIYNNSDLSSLIKKRRNYFDDQVYKLATARVDKAGVSHELIYVLLDARKPLARLNTDGRNEYKTEFKWMLVSDIQKLSAEELKSQNIDSGLQQLLNDRWDFIDAHFIIRMCVKS